AKHIVDTEASRWWRHHHYPPHVAATAAKPNCFGIKESDECAQKIRAGMDFLFQLIHHCLSTAQLQTYHDSAEPCLTDKSKEGLNEPNSDELQGL
ncbi:hypothetical protein DFH28DRAFT_868235, partial [Melampsora americana]